MTDLFQKSIDIILASQSPNGSFIASPNFPTYHFCWFRDASFVAYSMDLVGEHESSSRFHAWASEQINNRQDLVTASISKARTGKKLEPDEILHTRYRLDGQPDEAGDWPNFQLDGFGTWLWSLQEYCRLSRQPLPEAWGKAADLVAAYLVELWAVPCSDCWEEFPDHVHPHTQAAIYGGLKAHQVLRGVDHSNILGSIKTTLEKNAEEYGYFVKFPGSPVVDASLLGLSVPYGIFAPDDARMLKTVEIIEQTILKNGGLHRYAGDTYFGGGAWVILSAWLAWYYLELARINPELADDAYGKAENLKVWIEARAGTGEKEGWLPEQVPQDLNSPAHYPEWVARWGEIADPLLWSQAKYIIFENLMR